MPFQAAEKLVDADGPKYRRKEGRRIGSGLTRRTMLTGSMLSLQIIEPPGAERPGKTLLPEGNLPVAEIDANIGIQQLKSIDRRNRPGLHFRLQARRQRLKLH